MESLRLSFEAVMPIFLLMLLGYVLKLLNFASKQVFDSINKLIFKVFLPVLLFYNIYRTELAAVFDVKLILFTVSGVLFVFFAGYFVVLALTNNNAKRGVMLQGFFRSNYAILGIPIVGYICGGNTSGLSSLMVAIIVPLFNILAVICLERFRDGKVRLGSLLKGILTNPLVIGCAIGALFLALDLRLPSVVENAVSDLSGIASPLAMVVLGASFTFLSVKGHLKEIVITVSAKLIVIPLIMLSAAALLGFRGEALACIMVAFGAPVAVSSFAMAQQMGGDEKLAAQLVVISSALCLLTLFGWIFLLSYVGLF